MNIVLWILAGGLLGWLGVALLGINEERGKILATLIGAIGGVLGGLEVAPRFIVSPVSAGDFSMTAMLFALAVAAVFLAVSQLVRSHLKI